MGTALLGRIPLSKGFIPLTGRPPAQFVVLQDLLLEAARLPSVNVAFLEATKSSNIYRDWMLDQPLPRIQLQLPLLPWDLVWKRLSGPFLPLEAVDLHFRALLNILLTMERGHSLEMPLPLTVLAAPPWLRTASIFSHLVPGRLVPGTTSSTGPFWCLASPSPTGPSSTWPGQRGQRLASHPGGHHLLSMGVRGPPPTNRLSSQNPPGCC
jgi:hypothetical protein